MESSKSLRPPTNWQDFELLCKKLWEEIWNCPEIKKNGRSGQNQNGVDIYGIPKNETQYFGIQCKGKDQYTNKQFTKKEIYTEIEKAKTFSPSLKKLYFTTTATKDVKIEEIVREVNVEHIRSGLFEVHIFSWEDIVELIDENPKTLEYYTRSKNYRNSADATLSFVDDNLELTGEVYFQVPEFRQKVEIRRSYWDISTLNVNASVLNPKINQSYYPLILKLKNIGIDPIDDFKLVINLEGSYLDVGTNKRDLGGFSMIRSIYDKSPDINIGSNKQIEIVPYQKTLVSGDSIELTGIDIKPLHTGSPIIINWALLSKNYRNQGELKLLLVAHVIKVILGVEEASYDIEKSRREGKIEDHIVDC
ncbi:hypothetical protein QNI19_38675 [Cytophagaceae bacterium DM2B3-1]|uniref:Mrr-like domain-containing protein n=1 Tax=Xanthocytophaga flava TaxID=3048013 RepID=A0ABT7CYT5_9BACT|nr:hypothetical protein [Xanthocytophaga flavus]MDJ1498917.1 hypothetical protein [Xanthocytophaga flavus]